MKCPVIEYHRIPRGDGSTGRFPAPLIREGRWFWPIEIAAVDSCSVHWMSVLILIAIDRAVDYVQLACCCKDSDVG